MDQREPDIYEYADFRNYLQDYYRSRKKKDRKFSQRFIMQKVGARSSGWFLDVVKGRHRLNGESRIRLLSLLNLGAREEDYFITLVDYGQSGSHEERNHFFRKLIRFRGVKLEILGADKYEYFSKWYYPVIREFLFCVKFDGDFVWLAKQLKPNISAKEAKKAVEVLLRLELVKKNASGTYLPTKQSVKRDTAFDSMLLSNFLTANMKLAMDCLDNTERCERDVSAVTAALTEEQFFEIGEELRALRKKILLMSESFADSRHVYQCNFQVFPVTKIQKKLTRSKK